LRLMHWIFAICLFTASFDIVLVFEVGGTLRLTQILMIAIVLGGLAVVEQSGKILWPSGGAALVVWCCSQIIFMFMTDTIVTGIVFNITLFFTVLGVYAALQLYGQSNYIESLMRVYLASYIFVAAFGLFQLVSPSLHLGSYFVTQWIVYGKFPRINGFSYEPSYFASYVLMGWIMLIDLRVSKAEITASRRWKWIAFLMGLSLLLSTSRTAWLMMGFEGALRGIPSAFRAIRYRFSQFATGNMRIFRPRFHLFVASLILTGMAIAGGIWLSSIVDPSIFISGTGINNTASYSVSDRTRLTSDTFAVFVEHPWMGHGFAGVAQLIAENHGHSVDSLEDMKTWRGYPVILDVIAASGVIGVLPFLWFMSANSIGQVGLIRRRWPDERAKWLRALVRALIFEFIVLLESNGLLRVYLWFHLTMVVIVGFNLRYRRQVENLAQPVAVEA
jgi:hypothetical protein